MVSAGPVILQKWQKALKINTNHFMWVFVHTFLASEGQAAVFRKTFVCLLLLSQALWSWLCQIRCICWNAAGWIYWCWDWCGDPWIIPGNSSSHLTSNSTGKISHWLWKMAPSTSSPSLQNKDPGGVVGSTSRGWRWVGLGIREWRGVG